MNYFITEITILFIYMNLWFILSLLKKRNDVADVAWGLGFVLMAWTSFYYTLSFSPKALLVNILVSIWGLRLAIHIHARNKGKQEDYRYEAWRKEWGKWFYLRSYLQVYILQGALLFLIVLPVLFINKNSGPGFVWSDYLGLIIWSVGFYFESVGDLQLANFIKNPQNKGKIIRTGLWAYSRHPNYFGEVTQWWGIFVLALSSPASYLSIIGPITISFLILKVSGIPLLEKKLAENPEFENYKKEVSVFFPLPPKRT